jgi:DNA repair photolyase
LKEELEKKRALPQWAILNTSSDCFQPHPDILDVTYEVFRILLEQGVGISFLTKGVIPRQFIDLFGRSPQKILAQIGLVSLSEQYWREYEPGTPSPQDRLENIQELKAIGIVPEIRVDPTIPFVTDTETEAVALFRRLKETKVNKVTLSYLHLRPAIEKQLMKELSPLHRKMMESCFGVREWKAIGSSSKTKLLPTPAREKGYQRMKEIAERFGITASVCQCKNPDLKGDLCGSGRAKAVVWKRDPIQLPLFRC